MKSLNKVKIAYIIVLAAILLVALVIALIPKKEIEKPKYEPAPAEAPRLTSLGVIGHKIEFNTEVRYYEIELPAGNPNVPDVWATVVDGIELIVHQASFGKDALGTSAYIYLDNGEHQNSYEIRFIKNADKGIVLQYDDRYTFTPNYELKNGEFFIFKVEGEGGNVTVDANGIVRAVGVSDMYALVNAYVNGKIVDSLAINRTEKATLDVFIVAGQGNAGGEGGNKEESIKTIPGTAYTAELNDRTNSMVDLAEGRQGFTPAFADKWYSFTSNKSLFVQTAISDISVEQWTAEGEAFKMAQNRITDFMNILNAEDSNYTVNKVVCFWLQGEWDIAQKMQSDEYVAYFTSFYDSLKTVVNFDMLSLIPVRSSLNYGESKHIIEPVCAAQYQLNNMYDDIRIMTLFPDQATVENGYVADGNLYYTQMGYNMLGQDIAMNMFNYYDASKGHNAGSIEVAYGLHDAVIKQGDVIKLKNDETLRTVAVALPLYSQNGRLEVKYDETLVKYEDGGVFSLAEENTEQKSAEIKFVCDNTELAFTIEFVKKDITEVLEKTVYTWNFDSLETENQNNKLTLSERSAADGYVLQDGILTSANRAVDFLLEKQVVLNSENNWSIEWKGLINDNGIILGGNYTTKGFIYLAPFASNMENSIRMVDDEGRTFYLKYGEYIEANRTECVWKIGYDKNKKEITLYANGNAIHKEQLDEKFTFTLTNLFGRYGSDRVNHCYTGSIDRLNISVG